MKKSIWHTVATVSCGIEALDGFVECTPLGPVEIPYLVTSRKGPVSVSKLSQTGTLRVGVSVKARTEEDVFLELVAAATTPIKPEKKRQPALIKRGDATPWIPEGKGLLLPRGAAMHLAVIFPFQTPQGVYYGGYLAKPSQVGLYDVVA